MDGSDNEFQCLQVNCNELSETLVYKDTQPIDLVRHQQTAQMRQIHISADRKTWDRNQQIGWMRQVQRKDLKRKKTKVND